MPSNSVWSHLWVASLIINLLPSLGCWECQLSNATDTEAEEGPEMWVIGWEIDVKGIMSLQRLRELPGVRWGRCVESLVLWLSL